jgi:SH3 domain-containing YSC84-like protein 1
MDAAATVLDEIMGIPDKGIPEELLDSAKCVAVIPSMVEIGFVFGGRHKRIAILGAPNDPASRGRNRQ